MPLTIQKTNPKMPVKRPASFRGRVPTKTEINFAQIGVRRVRWWLLILCVLLALAAIAAFVKFLVYDKLEEVSAAQAEAAQVRSQLDESYRRIDSYGELNEIYAHYTYSGMTEEELARVDRVAVMDLLQRVVLPRTEVNSWILKENQLKLSIEGDTLKDINDTVQLLMEDELVNYCEVNTATTDVKDKKDLESSGDKVTANIIVYLSKAEEVAEK